MSADEEWHYIQVPKLGRAWVGWGKAKNLACMRKHGVSFEAMMIGLLENGIADASSHGVRMMNPVSSSKPSTRAAKPSVSYAGEPADVRALLEVDDRGEAVSMSRAEIRALFKPGKGEQAK